MKTPKDELISSLQRTTSNPEGKPVGEEMKKSKQNSKRYTNPTSYEIKSYQQQMYRVRFTNGLSTILSEDAVNEGRWGNIEHVEKEGMREIHYITM